MDAFRGDRCLLHRRFNILVEKLETNVSETRDVERIKCKKCDHETEEFEVSRAIFCLRGPRRAEVHEFPVCPRCKSISVLEIIAQPKGSQMEFRL